MKLPTLSSYNFKNKLVLLRSDLNSDVKNGKILDSVRIKASAETIKELKKKGARVVVIAHQGRKGNKDYTTLEQHAKQLNKYVKIKYVNDVIGNDALEEVRLLGSGEALLLDNIRFVEDEMSPKNKPNKILKFFFQNKYFKPDFYVNDAFSVSHREQTSITEFPKYVKSCIGRVMEKELEALEKFSLKDTLYILAGAKPEDNLKLMKSGRRILAGGLFGQLCLITNGVELGYMNKYFEKTGNIKYVPELKKLIKKCKVITPLDFAVNKNGKRVEIKLEEFPSEYEIYDIGEKTQEIFVKEILKAKSVYVKGPLGYCEEEKFAEGTYAVLRAVAKNNGFSLIGGGHISNAIVRSGISKKKFGYISLSGGALISYLAGEKLVGVEVLKEMKQQIQIPKV